MLSLYDQNAPKKPTNLSVNSDLLKKARDLDINLSAALEQALTEQLKAKQAQQCRIHSPSSRTICPSEIRQTARRLHCNN